MVEGIENTKCVTVFVTVRYRDKINQKDTRDNAKFEFNRAFEHLGVKKLKPVVMEVEMIDQRAWGGMLAACIGNSVFIDLVGLEQGMALFEEKVDEKAARISQVIAIDDFALSSPSISDTRISQKLNLSLPSITCNGNSGTSSPSGKGYSNPSSPSSSHLASSFSTPTLPFIGDVSYKQQQHQQQSPQFESEDAKIKLAL